MCAGEDPYGDEIRIWCTASDIDKNAAFCLLCNERVKVALRGRDNIIRHASSKSHMRLANSNRDENGRLKISKPKQLTLLKVFSCASTSPKQELSFEDQVSSAEAIWVASVAVSHLPTHVADVISPTFPAMFTDSKIANSFACRRNKTSRILSDGFGPYFRAKVENEIRNSAPAFTIEIDEATTAKNWRQLEVLVRYYSEERNRVVVYHLSSITLGRAQASLLASKLIEVITPLYARKLLQISSDGPNVMKALTKELKQNLNPNMVDIGTCNIHKVHNAFSSALDNFGDDMERLGIELFQLFKYSPTKREDFELVQEQLGIKKHVFLRHVECRWLTLQDVANRLEEQLPAILQFFQKSKFVSSQEKLRNERMKRLIHILANRLLLVEIQFLKSVMKMFTRITRMFQTEAPLVPILHDELSNLIVTLMRRFIKAEVIGKKTGVDLYNIDLNDVNNLCQRPDIGNEAVNSLNKALSHNLISHRDHAEFLHRAQRFYIDSVTYLLKSLPLKNTILRDLQVLHPLSRNATWSTDAIRRLAVAIKLFPQEKIDLLIDEWRQFRVEDIPFKWNSYDFSEESCEDIDNEKDDDDNHDDSDENRIDLFWAKVFQLKTATGLQKFPILSHFMRIGLTFAHGNADVERAFSENKLILTPMRTSMSDATLNGYKATSSYMKQFNSKPEKLPISQALLKAVRNSRQEYYRRISESRRSQSCPAVPEHSNSTNVSEKDIDNSEKAKRQMQEAESLRSEAMNLIQSGMKSKDFNKVSAANAILERSETLYKEAEKCRKEVEKEVPRKRKKRVLS